MLILPKTVKQMIVKGPIRKVKYMHPNLSVSVKVRVNTTPTAVQYFSEIGDWMIVTDAVASYMEKQGFVSIDIAGEVPVHRVYSCWNPDNRRKSLQWLREKIL